MLSGNPFVLSKTSFGSVCSLPSIISRRSSSTSVVADSTARNSTAVATSQSGRTISAQEARLSLVFALASQASTLSQRVLLELASETSKYLLPKRFESRTLEEALMAVPDLETLKFKVLSRRDEYEIREVEPYFIAETTMPGKSGFDFGGASQSFNVLAAYLFGKNKAREKMEMTTPVLTSQYKSDGEKMDMTTPVITKNVDGKDQWKMSFVIPSKYGQNIPVPQDTSVRIQEVPRKILAVVAFSGFVTDDEIKRRESRLRDALKNDKEFQVKAGSFVEVAQYNPPFTLPFQRRNEIALEVEKKEV
ncbi:heme-binding-like protein [Cucumis melo var. makuwa]|uniref:Heme-binding-like protein n=2 Tax=Cucumis melo TaxID=3656 RepID=A0A5A7TKZ9_CUCMM|nr:heme-binding-like protein [Cucumis melo var. makuwa]TYK25257.1 heme-binding-like protein [Cucumis melo var. makuwa]